jgi:hypothetical protein
MPINHCIQRRRRHAATKVRRLSRRSLYTIDALCRGARLFTDTAAATSATTNRCNCSSCLTSTQRALESTSIQRATVISCIAEPPLESSCNVAFSRGFKTDSRKKCSFRASLKLSGYRKSKFVQGLRCDCRKMKNTGFNVHGSKC